MPQSVAHYTPDELTLRCAVMTAVGQLTDCQPDISDAVQFMRGYLETAEWLYQGGENGDEPIPNDCKGFAPDTIADVARDCVEFMATYDAALAQYCAVTGRELDSAGTDYWLTRNGHGAGFWDRGNADCLTVLTEASHDDGGTDIYYYNDGYLHICSC